MISFCNGRKRVLGEGEKKDVYITMHVDFRQHLKNLKGAKFAVFMSIALHANEDGWAWPSAETIAMETGYSRDTIFDALAELEKVTIDEHPMLLRHNIRESGQFTSNRYLLFPSEEEIKRYKPVGILPCRDFVDTVKDRHKEEPVLKEES